MKIKAFMLAFADGAERRIEVPDALVDEAAATDERGGLLELAFRFGQNDFALPADRAQGLPSLSVGDVVELPDGSLHRVRGCGWEALPEGTEIASLERGRDAAFLF